MFYNIKKLPRFNIILIFIIHNPHTFTYFYNFYIFIYKAALERHTPYHHTLSGYKHPLPYNMILCPPLKRCIFKNLWLRRKVLK